MLNVADIQAAGGVFHAGGLETEFVERLDARGQATVDSAARKIEGVAAGVREYVQNHDIDLVVVGSHGRSNLRRQLIGSVASTVLRTVDVPVLVVKPSD